MDFNRARAFAVNHLLNNLPNTLYYHNIDHTRNVVVPAAERLGRDHALADEDMTLLLTAAWFHDTGFSVRYEKNEPIGAALAGKVLPDFGYNQEHIARVIEMIMATQMPQTPRNLLEQIIADADMDILGRVDFEVSAKQLRKEEREWLGKVYTDAEWYQHETHFLSHHRYFTRPQRRFRNKTKIQNYLLMAKYMMQHREHNSNTPSQFDKDDTQPMGRI